MTHTQQGMQRYLTTSQKDRERPRLLQKQEGKCLFCKDAFVPNPANNSMRYTIEHLDGNVFNNDIANLALAHKKCNNEKKHNSDYQIIARHQLQDNHNSFDSLDACVSQTHEPKETSKQIDINVAFYKITKDYVNDRLLRQLLPEIHFNDTAESVAYLMKEQTNHGSSATAKRYLNELSSSVAPFDRVERGGVWYIIKRQ